MGGPAPGAPGDPGATLVDRCGETGLAVAGAGAPLVEEFAVPAFAARLGLCSEAGAALVGEALELRHRLPRLWARVQAGEVEAWRARRRIAAATIRCELTPAAAGFVDRHLAPVAASAGLATIARCLDEAITRCMPGTAPDPDEDTPTGPDPRRFVVDRRQVSFEGTLDCHGTLDLADALAVHDAVTDEMRRLRGLGATDPAGPLSAAALTGLVTRRDPTLDELTTPDPPPRTPPPRTPGPHRDAPAPRPGDPAAPAPARRRPHQHQHQHPSRSRGRGRGRARGVPGRGDPRPGHRRPGPHLVRRPRHHPHPGPPVLDLDQRSHVEQYEMPDRTRTQAVLTALNCVFPRCTRPARATSRTTASHPRCDTDHAEPFDHHAAAAAAAGADQPGPTASDNAASLCRHHRLKTHAPARHRWRLTQLDHGRCLWRSPHGEHHLRDHTGTHPVTAGPDPPPLTG